MSLSMLALRVQDPGSLPQAEVGTMVRGLLAAALVLGLVALFAWLLRRGAFGPMGRRVTTAMRVETALPLGERRSLVIVAVEGRRLLLGLTPGSVAFVAELGAAPPAFAGVLDRAAESAHPEAS